MARWIVAGLIVLNVMLGVGVYLRVMEKTAKADIGRPATDYAAISGQSNNNAILYVLEISSGKLSALQVDPTNKTVKQVATKNVATDLARIK